MTETAHFHLTEPVRDVLPIDPKAGNWAANGSAIWDILVKEYPA